MSERASNRLYPRLLHADAASLAREYRELPLPELEARADTGHPHTIFTPTGGTRVGENSLRQLRDGVREIAEGAGYPEPFPKAPPLSARHQFDFEVARFLHRQMDILPGEAGKDDVWEFVACVLLPEFVRWRFPGNAKSDFNTSTDRYLGGDRNTYQRLWWRAELLSEEGKYRLLEQLNEDELVQIMERPYLASQRELTRLTARLFAELVNEYPDVDRMDVMRNAQKRLRRLAPLVAFSILDSRHLQAEVKRVLSEAARAVSGITVAYPTEDDGEEVAPPTEIPEEALEAISEQVEGGVTPLDRAILEVLVEAFPERLDAQEILEHVRTRLDGDERPAKSDVNRSLYRSVRAVLDMCGEKPPRWCLKSSVMSYRETGEREPDGTENGSVLETEPGLRADEGVTGDSAGDDSISGDGDELARESDTYRVVMSSGYGELSAQLVGEDRGRGEDEKLHIEILSRLVEFQTHYFRNGPRVLKPLSREELADEMGVNPSTVSNAVGDAHLQFRDRIIPAEDLFSPGLPTASGGEVSATAVRDMIAEFLTTTRGTETISDAELVSYLSDQGVNLTRGTVAKYRGQLGIDGEEATQEGPNGIGIRVRSHAGNTGRNEEETETKPGVGNGERTDPVSDEARLESRIIEVLSHHDGWMTDLEIAEHIAGADRSEVRKALKEQLSDRVESEGLSPPRWYLKDERTDRDSTARDEDSMEFWDRVVLDTLVQSPYRLTAAEIARTINEETELETDESAVEAILYGPLQEKVKSHGGSPPKWSPHQ